MDADSQTRLERENALRQTMKLGAHRSSPARPRDVRHNLTAPRSHSPRACRAERRTRDLLPGKLALTAARRPWSSRCRVHQLPTVGHDTIIASVFEPTAALVRSALLGPPSRPALIAMALCGDAPLNTRHVAEAFVETLYQGGRPSVLPLVDGVLRTVLVRATRGGGRTESLTAGEQERKGRVSGPSVRLLLPLVEAGLTFASASERKQRRPPHPCALTWSVARQARRALPRRPLPLPVPRMRRRRPLSPTCVESRLLRAH
jgi:hypothetical protein